MENANPHTIKFFKITGQRAKVMEWDKQFFLKLWFGSLPSAKQQNSRVSYCVYAVMKRLFC
jgi:hypothetical protein